MILAIQPRRCVDSAGQGGSAGSAELRIVLLATLGMKLRPFGDLGVC